MIQTALDWDIDCNLKSLCDFMDDRGLYIQAGCLK